MLKPKVVVDQKMNARIKGYFSSAGSKDEVVLGFVEGYCLGLHKSRWHQNPDKRVPPQQFKNAVNIGALIAANTSSTRWCIKIALADNPLFTLNGHDNVASPATKNFLINRIYESAASKVSEQILPSLVTVAGSVNAAGSSEARLMTLQALARKNNYSGKIADWLDVVKHMARRKRNVKSAKLTGKVIGCFLPFGSYLAKPVVMYLKSGKASFEFVCTATAIELHWRAFVEQTEWKGQKSEGPATLILRELFQHRGLKQLVCKSEIDSMMKEPAGWIPIRDVLLSL